MKDPIVITIIKSDDYLYASENVFIDSKNVTDSYTKKSWWHSVSVKLGQVKNKKRKKEMRLEACNSPEFRCAPEDYISDK